MVNFWLYRAIVSSRMSLWYLSQPVWARLFVVAVCPLCGAALFHFISFLPRGDAVAARVAVDRALCVAGLERYNLADVRRRPAALPDP